MRYYTFPRVFPHAGIHTSACISACGNPRKNVYSPTFFPAEIHESACKLTCVNSPSRLNFRMWKYTKKWVFPHVGKSTIFGVFPRAEMHDLMWIFHIGKSVFPPVRIYTYFCVFLHAVIHLKLCKSASAETHFSSCGNSH